MDAKQTLDHAGRIARIIIAGSISINRKKCREMGTLNRSSMKIALRNDDVEAMDPTPCDIIVFGSAAKGEGSPADVNMMIIDKGFYSNVFWGHTVPRQGAFGVADNLRTTLVDRFQFDEKGPEVAVALGGPKIELLSLPVGVITDPAKRKKILSMQGDPDYFRNAFTHMRHFNEELDAFVPIGLPYLEKKYGADLSDLRDAR